MAVVSVAIMAHPSRARTVSGLLSALDADANVVWDRCDNEWDTGKRALMAFDPSATHHLVVQDDAIVCRDLVKTAGAVASASGEHPVSLYTGRVRPHAATVELAQQYAVDAGASWLQMPGPWWGVAIMLPTNHILDLVTWADRRGQHISEYDRRIARWYIRQQVPCWYTVPSLVDHRLESDSPSLIPGHASDRTAHNFIGSDVSGLDVSWEPIAVKATRNKLTVTRQ